MATLAHATPADDGTGGYVVRVRAGERTKVQHNVRNKAGDAVDIHAWTLTVASARAYRGNDKARPAAPSGLVAVPDVPVATPTVAFGPGAPPGIDGVFWLTIPEDVWGGDNPKPNTDWPPVVVAVVALERPQGIRDLIPVQIVVRHGVDT